MTSRPSQTRAARSRARCVSSPKPAAVSSIRAFGSMAEASSPQAITSRSGANASHGRGHDVVPGVQVGAPAGARRERDVDVRTERAGPPASVDHAGVVRVEAVLVQRDRQRVRVVVVDPLGAVAVVHVPVDDRDPSEPGLRAGLLHRHRDVGEDAVAASPVALGVVPGRPDQREGDVDLAVDDSPHRRVGTPGRAAGDVVGARPERSELARDSPVSFAAAMRST